MKPKWIRVDKTTKKDLGSHGLLEGIVRNGIYNWCFIVCKEEIENIIKKPHIMKKKILKNTKVIDI